MATFGEDFDIMRWAARGPAEDGGVDRDSEKHVNWHDRYPDNDEWERVRWVTVDLTPQGPEPTPRNIPISPDKPLDPYGSDGYTIEDAVQFAIDFGIVTP